MRIAINGFGRIGRMLTRELTDRKNVELVAVNDLSDPATLLHLYKYDSIHGNRKEGSVLTKNGFQINGQNIAVFSEKNPEHLPWADLDIDIVVESTGLFRDRAGAGKHLSAGAKKVILSAPPKSEDIKSVCLGINEEILDGSEDIISNASCTTNSAAPLVKVLRTLTTIEAAYITTIHSYTGDQRLHDTPHNDLRRARAGAVSIVPTTTGAAKAITKIFPDLGNVMGGCGIRVPVPDGSLTDMTFIVKDTLSIEQINNAFKKASQTDLKGILEYTEDPIVSVDIQGNKHSCIFDSLLTSSIGKMVKVMGWYDNEIGYSARLADLIEKFK